jgi:aspartyl protease family protein
MGTQDKNSQAQSEREKQRQIEKTHSKFAVFSHNHLSVKVVSPAKSGLIPMLIFSCVEMGLLYMAMTHYLKPKQALVTANGDIVISRSQDGHFYTVGSINGNEAKFMVDAGATLVSVSEAFARKAIIRGGVPTTFRTANGDRLGRVVDEVVVSIRPVTVTNVTVGVGLRMGDDN